MKTLLTIILIALAANFLNANPLQNQNNNWYFGSKTAITFNTPDGKPIPIEDSEMAAYEGCTSVSSASGSLLFYTNGVKVWNKFNEVILNASNLMGSISSTSSAIAILKPGTISEYALFTLGDINQGGTQPNLYYHEIDFKYKEGEGVVNQANTLLRENMTEKLAGIYVDCNKAWVAVRAKSGHFYIYEVNRKGLESKPLYREVNNGVEHSCDLCTLGEMKFSSAGNYIAAISVHKQPDDSYKQILEVFEFNKANAEITELYTLEFESTNIDGYTFEFSPDEKKIYFERKGKLIQIDLNQGSNEAIQNSATEVRSLSEFFVRNGLKLGPDNKIYFAEKSGSNYSLLCIDNPNANASSLSISTAIASINLFNHNKFPTTPVLPRATSSLPSPTLKVENACLGDLAKISIIFDEGEYSYQWEKPDGHIVYGREIIIYETKESDNGWYKISIVDKVNCRSITDSIEVMMNPVPTAEIENESLKFCKGDSVLLSSKYEHDAYLWSNGDTSRSVYATTEGEWSLTAINEFGCRKTVSIFLSNYDLPEAHIEGDTLRKCPSKSLIIEVSTEAIGYKYLWSTGETSKTIVAKDTGAYHVEVKNKFGCIIRDTVFVMNIDVNPVMIDGETTFCKGESTQLTATSNFKNYLWSTGETTRRIEVTEPGEYSVRAETYDGCLAFDTVSVEYYPDSEFEINGSRGICEGNPVTLEVSREYSSYLWSTGEQTKSIIITTIGTYWVEVVTDYGCTIRETVEIIAGDSMDVSIEVSDSSPCVGESVTLTALPKGNFDYRWSNGFATPSITVSESGTYSVVVSINGGCEGEATIDIEFHDIIPVEIVSSAPVLCKGDPVYLTAVEEYISYLWSTGETTRVIEISEAGTYTLKVENEYGCIDSTSITLEVIDNLEASISPESPIELCEGESATLTAFPEGDYNYEWSTGETSSKITVFEPGSYSVIVSVGEACSDTAFAEVQLLATPPLSITADSDVICEGSELTLTASGGFKSYLWSTGETTQEIIITEAREYTVTGSYGEHCTTSASIEIMPAEAALYFPADAEFNLDSLHIGESSSAAVTFVNNSDVTTEILIEIDNPDLSVAPANKQLILQPLDAGEITLTYDRKQPERLSDNVKISIDKPCKIDYMLPVRGVAYALTRLSADEQAADVGTEFCLPIFGEIIKKSSPPLSSKVILQIAYESSAMNFKRATEGTIISDKIIDGMRIITIEIDALTLDINKKIITEICGDILVGKNINTDVQISEAEWDRELIFSQYDSGTITAYSCEPGMNQIDILNPSQVEISPNPASGQLLVEIETEEIGKISLQLINSRGETIQTNELTGDGNVLRQSYSFDTAALSSGVYFITLTTPMSMISKPVIIKK